MNEMMAVDCRRKGWMDEEEQGRQGKVEEGGRGSVGGKVGGQRKREEVGGQGTGKRWASRETGRRRRANHGGGAADQTKLPRETERFLTRELRLAGRLDAVAAWSGNCSGWPRSGAG